MLIASMTRPPPPTEPRRRSPKVARHYEKTIVTRPAPPTTPQPRTSRVVRRFAATDPAGRPRSHGGNRGWRDLAAYPCRRSSQLDL